MTSTKIVLFIAQCLCELPDLERFERCNRFVSAAIEGRTTALMTAEIEACEDDRTPEISLHKKIQEE